MSWKNKHHIVLDNGQRLCIADIFESNHQMLLAYGQQQGFPTEQVKDTINDLFIYLIEKKDRLKIKNPKAYLYLALRNKLIDLKTKNPQEESLQSEMIVLASEEEYTGLREQQLQWLQEKMNHMPAKRREAFLLKREHELTYAQIGEAMEISQHTAREYVTEAMRSLMEAAKEDAHLFEEVSTPEENMQWVIAGMAILVASGLLKTLG
ncbi:RNA polymerase sigma factor [Persicobacter sp. CCB-QB2]|uniref:RNA polymerase sigma factor n=1 Tax=Persicobacter sp. CCB-QB2 TaxID=1561025 RepID=UPI0006A9751C|nr:sigma-70 family RNA polymerase sigma factor [Persicobacter sp. CCB-QB2]